jgi:hypothetical protein
MEPTVGIDYTTPSEICKGFFTLFLPLSCLPSLRFLIVKNELDYRELAGTGESHRDWCLNSSFWTIELSERLTDLPCLLLRFF